MTDVEADKKSSIDKVEENKQEIINDRDRDGVVDTLDLCPDEYGEEAANGCPDFDNDGIPNRYDLCPHLFGNISIQGCPELTSNESNILSMALQDLRFDVDKSVIKYESFQSLTNLAVLMHKNPKMILVIEGHASSEGSSLYNLNLSAQRSKAVQQFFIDRGITKERLNIDFYGEDAPLNNNSTEEERAENRRVHFEIKYHLIDRSIANDLQVEYDSLRNVIYGEASSDKSTGVINVLEENEIQFFTKEAVDSNLAIQSDSTIDYGEIIDDSLEDDIEVVETKIKEQREDKDKGEYLVIVQVFSDVSNAVNYTESQQDSLEYTSINGKYYVFAFSSIEREEAEKFRDKYGKDCWILDPR